MPRGGFRPGSGRPKKRTAKASTEDRPEAIGRAAKAKQLSPLEYMLSVMNDPRATRSRRDRMAQSAAPFVHKRTDEPEAKKGKKELQQEAAHRIATGRFEVPQPPRLVSNRP